MDELVSVILPVYNVRRYLDKCIQSILRQTYSKLEIILVDDGSTDGSGEACECWAKRDSRIKVIRTENRGVGNARNTGIELAAGKYLVFVDPDDWVHELFIEKMWKEMVLHDADIVSCDLMLYYEQDDRYVKKKIKRHFYIIENEEKKDYLFYIPVSMCCKLFKRELFADQNNRFPDFFYEDAALFPQLVYQAGKIIHVDDFLYYYLKDRMNSTTNSVGRTSDITKAIRYSFTYFQSRNILKGWEEPLRKYYTWRLYYRYMLYKGEKISKDCGDVLEEFVQGWQRLLNTKAYVWGSFNTRWSVYAMNFGYQSIGRHVCFSGLISQMLGKKLECELVEEKFFRRRMLEYDFFQKVPEELMAAPENEINAVIFDLLEERYDILETEDGCYVTDSEAYRENGIVLNVVNRIEAGSEQHWKLWVKACNRWIAMIENMDADIDVIMLKMRLAEGYQGENGFTLFEDQDLIKRLNNMIDKMEKYLIENCSRILFLQVEDPFYANESCGYGCAPQYLVRNIYRKYEAMIVEYIKSKAAVKRK